MICQILAALEVEIMYHLHVCKLMHAVRPHIAARKGSKAGSAALLADRLKRQNVRTCVYAVQPHIAAERQTNA